MHQAPTLDRPATPRPCAPEGYIRDKTIVLNAVRTAIQSRGWECKDLHAYYPSIRKKAFEALMDGEDWTFSMRFAYSIAEAVGVSPARALEAAHRPIESLALAAYSVARAGGIPGMQPGLGSIAPGKTPEPFRAPSPNSASSPTGAA